MALKTPVRLVSMVSLHWVASMVQIEPSVEMPALATRMSTDPRLRRRLVGELHQSVKVADVDRRRVAGSALGLDQSHRLDRSSTVPRG